MNPNWLRNYRKKLRLTQGELSAKLQLEGLDASPAAVSHWETGRYNPPLSDTEFRNTLARILKISPQELLAAAGYETEQSHSAAGERAADIVDSLPEDQQRIAIGILEQFIERV